MRRSLIEWREDRGEMHIFTYGSLMYHPVWRRVVSGTYGAAPATARGYARRRIRGELYPGLVRAVDRSTVDGLLYLDVSPADVMALDRFEGEGEAYARIRLPVTLRDGSVTGAWSYLFLDAARVEESVWEPRDFEADGLSRFIGTYCAGRAPLSTENL